MITWLSRTLRRLLAQLLESRPEPSEPLPSPALNAAEPEPQMPALSAERPVSAAHIALTGETLSFWVRVDSRVLIQKILDNPDIDLDALQGTRSTRVSLLAASPEEGGVDATSAKVRRAGSALPGAGIKARRPLH